MKPFSQRVYEIVEQIPFGKVLSYGDIARLIGSPRAARQVGWAMRNCPDNLPWQRVVMSDGSITGGNFAQMRKMLLAQENVEFLPDGKVNMKTNRWIR